MLNLGNLTFGLGADTSGMQNALDALSNFQQSVQQTASIQQNTSAASVVAWNQQAVAIRQAYQAASQMRNELKDLGATPNQLSQVTTSLRGFIGQMTTGTQTTAAINAAQAAFAVRLGEVKTAAAAVNPPTDKMSAFSTALKDVASAGSLTLGPLNGISSRLSAVGAIFNRSTAQLALTVIGISAAVYAFAKLSEGAIASEVAMEKINSQLSITSGGAAAAAVQFQYISTYAEKMGMDTYAAADNFAKLTIAAQSAGIGAQGTRTMFEGLSTAAKALGKDTEDTTRLFDTFDQILNRQIVDSRELRQRLGNELTGSFYQAAQAIGVSTDKLNEMLKAGELGPDVLVKLSTQLSKTYGPAAVGMIDNVTSSTARLHDAQQNFSRALDQANGISASYTRTLNGLAGVLDFVANHIQGVEVALAALAAVFVSSSFSIVKAFDILVSFQAFMAGPAIVAITGFIAALRAMTFAEMLAGIGAMLLELPLMVPLAIAAGVAFLVLGKNSATASPQVKDLAAQVDAFTQAAKGAQGIDLGKELQQQLTQAEATVTAMKAKLGQQGSGGGFIGGLFSTDANWSADQKTLLQAAANVDLLKQKIQQMSETEKAAASVAQTDAYKFSAPFIEAQKTVQETINKLTTLQTLNGRMGSKGDAQTFEKTADAMASLANNSDKALNDLSQQLSKVAPQTKDLRGNWVDINAQTTTHEQRLEAVAGQLGTAQGKVSAITSGWSKLNTEAAKTPDTLAKFNISLQEIQGQTAALQKGPLALEEYNQAAADTSKLESFRLELEKTNLTLQQQAERLAVAKQAIIDNVAAHKQFDEVIKPGVENMQHFVTDGVDALTSSLESLEDRTTTVAQAFKAMATSIVNDIIKMQMEENVAKPISNFISGSGITGLGGLIGSLFGGGTDGNPQGAYTDSNTGINWNAVPSQRADGGELTSGQTYIVGEAGPELMHMGSNGSVSPLGNGDSGGVNITIINNTGSQVSAKQSNSSNGDVTIQLDTAMAGILSNPNSRSTRAIKSSASQGVMNR